MAAAKHAPPRPSACISTELKHGARGDAAKEAGWTPRRGKGVGKEGVGLKMRPCLFFTSQLCPAAGREEGQRSGDGAGLSSPLCRSFPALPLASHPTCAVL